MLSALKQEELVRLSMCEAAEAVLRGDEPFGAVLADKDGNIVLQAGNREYSGGDPTAHAEIILMRKAAKLLGRNDLSGFILACNAESCSMCASALIKAGIREFYYGADMEELCDPYLRMEAVAAASKQPVACYGGILKEACREQIAAYRRTR